MKYSLCESCSVVSDSMWPHGLYSPWYSLGQNTRVGTLSLFQRMFPTQRLNPGLLHCRQILFQLSHKFNSVQFSHSVLSNSLPPHGPQHARYPVYHQFLSLSHSCPLSWWCHPAISLAVISFSSHLQSFPASGSFQMSPFFTSGVQSIGVSASASFHPINIQD